MKRNETKKKAVAFFSVLISSCLLYALPAVSDASDSRLYSEIVSAYSGAAYPSVVEYADELEKNYPESMYLDKSLIYKGESLFLLGRHKDAENVLLEASSKDDPDIKVQSLYWLGRSRLAMSKNNEALDSFFKCCQISKFNRISKKSENYYNLSLYYAGETYFAQEDYKNAIPVFESIVSRGDDYQVSLYCDSFIMLFECYLNVEKYSNLVALYRKTPESENPQLLEMYYRLTLLAAKAYENLGQYENSWNCCVKAFDSSDAGISSEALRIAYRISEPYEKETEKSTSSVFESNADRLNSNPALMAEFWTRLATDEFEKGNFEKAGNYFSKAEEFDDEKKYSSLIALYRGRMEGNTLELVNTLDESNEFYTDYETAFAEQYAAIEAWDLCYIHAKKSYESIDILRHSRELSLKASYYYALALFALGKTGESVSIIENGKTVCRNEDSFYVPFQKLLARCYSAIGKEGEALAIYSALDSRNNLNGPEKADYANLLFSCGYLSSARKVGMASLTPEGDYIAALSNFNLKNWNDAEKLFSRYLSSKPKRNADFALFYLGYCQYRLGKKSAYENLVSFLEKYPSHRLCYNACIVSANAALSDGEFEIATAQAQKAVSYSGNQSEKENAVLLVASIYADNGKLDSALETLSPFVKEKSEFGVRARYQSALLYAGAGRPSEADRLFSEIISKFPDSEYAEESCYNRGEIFYSAEKYSVALSRFSEYLQKFPKGKFSESALYYCGNCHRKMDNPQKAALQFEILLLDYPESTYAYSSCRNLVSSYTDLKNYVKAADYAKKMLSLAQTEDQRADAKKEISRLTKFISGGDSRLVVLTERYESEGGSATRDGRIAGTELAEYLWSDESKKDEAIELAEKLFSIQSKDKNLDHECAYAARCAVILAQSERFANENNASASIYLTAARYARKAGLAEVAARALYGAAEAFDAAGKKGDAKVTVENLIELYPESSYARNSVKLLER